MAAVSTGSTTTAAAGAAATNLLPQAQEENTVHMQDAVQAALPGSSDVSHATSPSHWPVESCSSGSIVNGQQEGGSSGYGFLPRLLYAATGTDVALMAWGWVKQGRRPGDTMMEVLLQVTSGGEGAG